MNVQARLHEENGIPRGLFAATDIEIEEERKRYGEKSSLRAQKTGTNERGEGRKEKSDASFLDLLF